MLYWYNSTNTDAAHPELLLRKAREKAGQLRDYENGLQEEHKTGEYESRLHLKVLSMQP